MGATNPNKLRGERQAPGPKKIETGLYLDFESYGGKYKPPPILCGYRFGGNEPVRQVVFTGDFIGAAKFDDPEYPVEYCENRKDYLNDLLFKERKGKKLFVYSPNEGDAIKRIIGFSIEKGLEDVLQFARGSFPEIKQPRQLVRYCKSAGICVPSDYGKGMVTTWLDKIKPYSKSLKAWASAPPEIRETWRLVLRHNRFDVSCMYDLLVKIKEKEQQTGDDE